MQPDTLMYLENTAKTNLSSYLHHIAVLLTLSQRGFIKQEHKAVVTTAGDAHQSKKRSNQISKEVQRTVSEPSISTPSEESWLPTS